MENVEIKARCAHAAAIAQAAAATGAVWESSCAQTDTYLNVPIGRLKLRHSDDGVRELIFYQRPNEQSPRLSRYERIPIAPGHMLDVVLTQALGIKAVVRKRRQVWRLDNIRIHLDEVEGLGSFVEFEVEVSAGRDVDGCRAQAQALLTRLDIKQSDLIAGSYADLML